MQCFALLGLVLFFGVAVAPSINANVDTDSSESPLFQMRSLRINNDNEFKVDSCYINQGNTITINIPKRTPLSTIQNMLLSNTRIKDKMNIENLNYLPKNNIRNAEEIVHAFNLFKDNPDYQNIIDIESELEPPTWPGFTCECTLGQGALSGCFIYWIFRIIEFFCEILNDTITI